MYDKFRKYTNKWLKTNSVSNDCIDDWLLGENYSHVKTVRTKENYIKKTPYHVYYKYKVDSNVSAATGTTSTSKRTTQLKNADKSKNATDSSSETPELNGKKSAEVAEDKK